MLIFKAQTYNGNKSGGDLFPTIYDNLTFTDICNLMEMAAKNPGTHLHFWCERVEDVADPDPVSDPGSEETRLYHRRETLTDIIREAE